MYYHNLKFGIIGGGQLGKMLIQACPDFNLHPSVIDPDEDAPCRPHTHDFVKGNFTDFDTLYQFGKDKNLLTIEIENINVAALEKLEREGVKVFPQPSVIKIIQDKRLQKQFFKKHQIPSSDFVLINSKEEVKHYAHLFPVFQKMGKSGYDGRGVQAIRNVADIDKAFEGESLLEQEIKFQKELSVIVARNMDGEVAVYPVIEMVFHPEQNLVEFLFAPAELNSSIALEAQQLAVQVIEKLGMVGLLAVEMFLTPEGKLLVNEVAPRPHNSGHQTIRANYTSQYEQHLRAILNLPLGSTLQYKPAAMLNLLGEPGYNGIAHYEGIEKAMSITGVFPFLYGKKYTKPFRKMGHITLVEDTVEALKIKANYIKELVKVKA
jgi:5-(carboxyamino)imidazole ribonucleotide synthase